MGPFLEEATHALDEDARRAQSPTQGPGGRGTSTHAGAGRTTAVGEPPLWRTRQAWSWGSPHRETKRQWVLLHMGERGSAKDASGGPNTRARSQAHCDTTQWRDPTEGLRHFRRPRSRPVAPLGWITLQPRVEGPTRALQGEQMQRPQTSASVAQLGRAERRKQRARVRIRLRALFPGRPLLHPPRAPCCTGGPTPGAVEDGALEEARRPRLGKPSHMAQPAGCARGSTSAARREWRDAHWTEPHCAAPQGWRKAQCPQIH